MKKSIFIWIIISTFSIYTSQCSNTPGTINKKSLSTIFPSAYLQSDSLNTTTNVSDSLGQSFKKIYLAANEADQLRNYTVALELYYQFINLSTAQNYDRYLWQEIRTSFSHISSIYVKLFNYEKAINCLKKALEITLKYNINDFINTYYFLYNIAQNYYSNYDYNNSLEYYHQAEALLLSTSSQPSIKKAQLYNNVALCYYKLGVDIESQNYLNESIRIRKSLGDFADLASNYNNIGLLFQKKGQFTEALAYFNKSLFLYDSLNKDERSAFIINNIGNLYLQKESYDSSKIYYQKSLLIRMNQPLKNYPDLIISYNNLSFISFKLNDLDSAILFNNLAFDLNIQNFGKKNKTDYFSIKDYLTSVADRIEINVERFNISKNVKFLIESYQLFNPTVKLLIDQLLNYNSIFSSNIFINEYKRFFDSTILSSHLLDSVDLNKCPRSLIISETYKSLSLLNVPSEIRNLQYDSISFNQSGNLNNYYQWQKCLLSKEISANEAPKILFIDSLINSTIETDLQNNKCIPKLKSNLYNYFDNLSDSILANCSKLANNLVIDFYIFNNSIFTHVISDSNISCFFSQTTKEFNEALHTYPKSIKSHDKLSIISLSQILCSNLIYPLVKIIKSHDNIIIIPDQNLTEIPFETMPYQQPVSLEKQYFIENKNISYRFSVLSRNYSNINSNRKYSEDFLGIAPFVINDSSSHNLNGSAREITEITNLFKSKKLNASALVGNNATYFNLTNSNLDSRILHFSTHSFINNQNTNLSFLELFPTTDQFYIVLPVLSSIPLHNDLLILNACETGSNLIDSSTGFVSFLRSMSNISIQNYICSLWKIYDEPSYEFIKEFYVNVLNGYSYSTALTLAKRSFINSTLYQYPLFWSPFILYENN